MSTDLSAHATGQLVLRGTVRALDKLEQRALVRKHRINLDAEVVIEKQAALTAATATGMTEVMRIGQLQAQYEQLNPALAGRLNALADNHAFLIASTVDELSRELRAR